MRYRVEDMPDGLILTAKKLPVAMGMDYCCFYGGGVNG